jgi:shikimate dehydrogenase
MYGLLGKKLGHSFSKEIHETFTNKQYKLIELQEIAPFMIEKDFIGINVTIPYKKDVIPFIDELSVDAKSIGVVNTIINKSGKLIGYNTDIYGLQKSLEYNKVSLFNKEVIILGNGSTSRTIEYFCKTKKAKKIIVLARNPLKSQYTFEDIVKFSSSTIIFNATPVGMYPNNIEGLNINLDLLPNLELVMDVIYNPLASSLIVEANKIGIQTVNGLLMLIFQAIKAIELFQGYKIKDNDVIIFYKDLLFKISNLVFIGMPMSGKSYFTKKVGTLFNKEVVDIDDEIEKTADMSITNIFEKYGETHFRKLEYDEVVKQSKTNNKAISCGGGVIKNQLNIDYLKQNGVILFIDFPLVDLIKCNPKGRPLLQKHNTLEKLYNERYHLYRENADIIIYKTSYDESETMRQIEVKINEYFNT